MTDEKAAEKRAVDQTENAEEPPQKKQSPDKERRAATTEPVS